MKSLLFCCEFLHSHECILFLRSSEIALEVDARLGKEEKEKVIDAAIGRYFSSGDFLWRD